MYRPTRVAMAVITCITALSAVQAQSTSAVGNVQARIDQTSGTPKSFMPRSEASVDNMKAQSTAIAAKAQQAFAAIASSSNGPQAGVFGPGPGCNLFPAPASVGTTIPITYFGPPPSTSNPSLVGPVQLLKSGVVDTTKGTITLPLYKGYLKGIKTPIWYILTDVSDSDIATELGLNFSTKLKFAAPGARTANFNSKGELIFNGGTVDFTPDRVILPGSSANPFPPIVAKAGAIGDKKYSPLVRVLNAGHGLVYEPSGIVWHHHRADRSGLLKQMFAYGTGLSAFMTKCLLSRGTRGDVLRRIPLGLRRMTAIRSETEKRLASDVARPPGALSREFLGFIAGPLLYARAERASRRLRVLQQ